MKRLAAVLFLPLILTALLSGCSILPFRKPAWPPKGWQQEDYGSFSPDITYSHDGKYYAVQTLGDPELDEGGARFINVSIYESATDNLVDSFPAQRAFDFWGICWEADSYNIWIQSGDIGTYCMRYAAGEWVKEDDYRLQMPEGMIDRFRMRQGSFQYHSAYSMDDRYVADRDPFEDCVIVYNAATGEPVFRYPIDQLKNFRGVCWDRQNNLWLRTGNDAFALRRDGASWVYDETLRRPDEVVLAYNWDGSVAD